jgi:hypothetical protein
MLLEKGADVNAKDADGSTAFFLANRRSLENGPEYPEIVNLLRQYIVAETIPLHLETAKRKKVLGEFLDGVRGTSNRGPDGKLPPDIKHHIQGWLGGKRKTRKKNSRGRKTRKKNSGGRKTPNAKRGRKLL